MTVDAMTLTRQEVRAARRLARLFRIERSGRLNRHPREAVRRLAERRGLLIDELARLDQRRRSLAPRSLMELDLAMGELTREVGHAEQVCLALLAGLRDELDRLRGEGNPSGLRDGAAGKLLGRV
jgi:hypothetical protein